MLQKAVGSVLVAVGLWVEMGVRLATTVGEEKILGESTADADSNLEFDSCVDGEKSGDGDNPEGLPFDEGENKEGDAAILLEGDKVS